MQVSEVRLNLINTDNAVKAIGSFALDGAFAVRGVRVMEDKNGHNFVAFPSRARGNKTDLKALKSKIIKSKLETCVKRDFMEYLEHDGENAIETLRKLIYDFLSAENAIIEAKQCNDIVEWTRTVVDRLSPSLKAYPNKQIDLALALILYEQTLRDASYGSVFCKFTEVYKNEGGVF